MFLFHIHGLILFNVVPLRFFSQVLSSQFNDSILRFLIHSFETTPKKWIKNLNIDSLDWDDKTWEKNLKGTTLKRIKPWMWRRNIKASLKNQELKI